MADSANSIKISMTFMSFAKNFEKCQIGTFKNKETGEQFKSLAFTNPGDAQATLVGFSSKLGELSAQELVAMKNDLNVVELESGNLKLCKKGESSWEEVNLF